MLKISEPRMPKGDVAADITYLYAYLTALLREIKWALSHFDEENIIKKEDEGNEP